MIEIDDLVLSPEERRMEHLFLDYTDANVDSINIALGLSPSVSRIDRNIRGRRQDSTLKVQAWFGVQHNKSLVYIEDYKFVGKKGIWTIDPSPYVLARYLTTRVVGELGTLTRVERIARSSPVLHKPVLQLLNQLKILLEVMTPYPHYDLESDACLTRIRDKFRQHLI